MHGQGFDSGVSVADGVNHAVRDVMAACDVHGPPQLETGNPEPEQAGLTQLNFRNLHNTRGLLGDPGDTAGQIRVETCIK